MFTHQLTVDYPGHTSALRPLRAELAALLPRSAFQDGPVAFIGSASGAEVGSDADFFDYWYESLCSTVRFDRAVVAAQKCGADTFVEMSAHPSLLYPLVELVDDESAVIVGSGHRDGPITDVLSANIAAVATADPGYRWADASPRVSNRRCADSRMRRCGRCTCGPRRNPGPHCSCPNRVALTIAVEDWQQAPSPTAADGTRCGIAIVGDTSGGAGAATDRRRCGTSRLRHRCRRARRKSSR